MNGLFTCEVVNNEVRLTCVETTAAPYPPRVVSNSVQCVDSWDNHNIKPETLRAILEVHENYIQEQIDFHTEQVKAYAVQRMSIRDKKAQWLPTLGGNDNGN